MTNVDRALLLAEWSSVNWRAEELKCPCCRATETNGQRPECHDPNCPMDLALSERGFCTQQDRDRARVLIAMEKMP